MNYSFFGKTIESVRKYRNIKFVTLEKRRIFINKPVYLGLSILEIRKTIMHKNVTKKQKGVIWMQIVSLCM